MSQLHPLLVPVLLVEDVNNTFRGVRRDEIEVREDISLEEFFKKTIATFADEELKANMSSGATINEYVYFADDLEVKNALYSKRYGNVRFRYGVDKRTVRSLQEVTDLHERGFQVVVGIRTADPDEVAAKWSEHLRAVQKERVEKVHSLRHMLMSKEDYKLVHYMEFKQRCADDLRTKISEWKVKQRKDWEAIMFNINLIPDPSERTRVENLLRDERIMHSNSLKAELHGFQRRIDAVIAHKKDSERRREEEEERRIREARRRQFEMETGEEKPPRLTEVTVKEFGEGDDRFKTADIQKMLKEIEERKFDLVLE